MKVRVLGATLFLMTAAAVFGQSRFDVPFAFHVGDNSFDAGRYNITTHSDDGVLWVIPQGRQAMLIMPQAGIVAPTAPSTGKLVFRCYEHDCFLSQVWRAGENVGTQLRTSRAEREVASRKMQPTSVYASVR